MTQGNKVEPPTDVELVAMRRALTVPAIAKAYGCAESVVGRWITEAKARGVETSTPLVEKRKADMSDIGAIRRRLLERALEIAEDNITDPKVRMQQARLCVDLYASLSVLIPADEPVVPKADRAELLARVKRATNSARSLRVVQPGDSEVA